MKNMKLQKMVLGVLVLNILGTSTLYPESWSNRYTRFKVTCSEKYKKAKDWVNKYRASFNFKKIAAWGVGLGVVGGASWYLLKSKSDRQIIDDLNDELHRVGLSKSNTIIIFESNVGNYADSNAILADAGLLNLIPNWKEELNQLPNTCNSLQRRLNELHARMHTLENKTKKPEEAGLLFAMREQEQTLNDLLPRLTRINRFLNDFKDYFYLVDCMQTLGVKYNSQQVSLSPKELDPIEVVIRDARLRYQGNNWPLIEYCEKLLTPDINQLHAFIEKAGKYNLTEEYQQALHLLNFLRAKQQDLLSSSQYRQEVQLRVEHNREQERLGIERERVRAMQARIDADLKRNLAIKRQTRAIERQTREQQRRHRESMSQTSLNNQIRHDLIYLVQDVSEDLIDCIV